MNSIDHLTDEEKQHYILCACGEYLDMRDLSDVFKHLHEENISDPQWTHSVKKGEAVAYVKSGAKLDLN
jgi:hypothetical protein